MNRAYRNALKDRVTIRRLQKTQDIWGDIGRGEPA